MPSVPRRPLGGSGIEVSALALGSFRTYERISREDGAAVLRAARECGIDFLDVARYDDETRRAPLATGYSEVVFGEVFRRSGWPRDDVFIATKLWWEFWPEQTAAGELRASRERTGLDRFDFVYSDPPPPALPLEDVVAAIGELVRSGEARAWGVVNWPAERIAAAGRIARDHDLPPPCAAQLPYSLAQRAPVEDAEMAEALVSCEASVVASFVLAGGILTGKYRDGRAGGRMAAMLDDRRFRNAVELAEALGALAFEWGTTPAALAVAFALSQTGVSSVLFGATSPAQVAENAGAAALLRTLGADELARLGAIGARH